MIPTVKYVDGLKLSELKEDRRYTCMLSGHTVLVTSVNERNGLLNSTYWHSCGLMFNNVIGKFEDIDIIDFQLREI